MSGLRFLVTTDSAVVPFAPSLRRLEQSIRYPIADGADHFFIDHGEHYHPFFSRMGRAYFLLALRGEEVVGSVVGVVRRVQAAGREVQGLYVGDLKVARSERGNGLARRMLQRGLGELLRRPELRACRLLYGAAMRGDKGDVMRSARGLSPLKLGSPTARLVLYFVPPERLARLDTSRAPAPPASPGLELGPAPAAPVEAPGLCSTAGCKDLRLESTGQPWPLVHLPLGPSAWRPSWGAYLRACGEALVERGLTGAACFGIDERLTSHTAWLAGQGVQPDATCTLYSLSLLLGRPAGEWVHLPTSEI